MEQIHIFHHIQSNPILMTIRHQWLFSIALLVQSMTQAVPSEARAANEASRGYRSGVEAIWPNFVSHSDTSMSFFFLLLRRFQFFLTQLSGRLSICWSTVWGVASSENSPKLREMHPQQLQSHSAWEQRLKITIASTITCILNSNCYSP